MQGGALRAAIFGVSDGLLTNVSLILGVAGANGAAGVVRLAGIAGLLAGAFSMAAGEYVSMSAQADMLRGELEIERAELARNPRGETRELAHVYMRRGLSARDSLHVARLLMKDPEVALEVHAREEMGVDPGDTGRPLAAAVSSFVSFAVGAAIPLIPWLFLSGLPAVVVALAAALAAALAIGWSVGLLTGHSRLGSALRQAGIAAVAALVTYLVGRIIGVNIV